MSFLHRQKLREANSLSNLDKNPNSGKSFCKVSKRGKGGRKDHLKVARGEKEGCSQPLETSRVDREQNSGVGGPGLGSLTGPGPRHLRNQAHWNMPYSQQCQRNIRIPEAKGSHGSAQIPVETRVDPRVIRTISQKLCEKIQENLAILHKTFQGQGVPTITD